MKDVLVTQALFNGNLSVCVCLHASLNAPRVPLECIVRLVLEQQTGKKKKDEKGGVTQCGRMRCWIVHTVG